MRIVVRLIVVALAALVAMAAGSMIASESGEVVVLQTSDAAGAPQETRLWLVEHGGHAWLRSGNDASSWFVRLQERPDVTVVRDDQALAVRAVPDVTQRATINDLMNEKYGWADSYIGFLFGRDDAVPIRLEPREP
jgi:hypothetical protein